MHMHMQHAACRTVAGTAHAARSAAMVMWQAYMAGMPGLCAGMSAHVLVLGDDGTWRVTSVPWVCGRAPLWRVKGLREEGRGEKGECYAREKGREGRRKGPARSPGCMGLD